MRLQKLTEKAQEALQSAAREAHERGQQAIEPDHLLLELVRQEGGIARPLLEVAGASIPGLEAALVSRVDRLPRVTGAAQPYLASELVRILNQAEKQAEQLKDDYVSIEHIQLRVTEPAKRLLAERGWGPVYGARPLKRTIQRLLQDRLALLILEARFQDGDQGVVDVENGELRFSKEARVEETVARAGA